jgi:hypothetical protein
VNEPQAHSRAEKGLKMASDPAGHHDVAVSSSDPPSNPPAYPTADRLAMKVARAVPCPKRNADLSGRRPSVPGPLTGAVVITRPASVKYD